MEKKLTLLEEAPMLVQKMKRLGLMSVKPQAHFVNKQSIQAAKMGMTMQEMNQRTYAMRLKRKAKGK